MIVRKRGLPPGWYPDDPIAAARELDSCVLAAQSDPVNAGRNNRDSLAVIAPHASWFFSGVVAAAALLTIPSDVSVIVVFGGHLPPREKPLLAVEDAFDTPFGLLASDEELRREIAASCDFRIDRSVDNTIEIQLPLVKRLFPKASIVTIRMPASLISFDFGKKIASIASRSGRSMAAIGSTDLTHYGDNYGFSPVGSGPAALGWVRETNDRRFLDALVEGDPNLALRRALEENSACSPGAAIAALGFAKESGSGQGELLRYATSADIRPSDSFVGYAAVRWAR